MHENTSRVSHLANIFFFSALLHMPRKAAGYAVPTCTAPLCGLLHCVACVAGLKKENISPVGDSGLHTTNPMNDAAKSLPRSVHAMHVQRRKSSSPLMNVSAASKRLFFEPKVPLGVGIHSNCSTWVWLAGFPCA